jgi:glycosyltransferase involved in cell wall biosynthesis
MFSQFTDIGRKGIHTRIMRRPRICILGSYSGRVDEGMANVSYYLYNNLKSVYDAQYLLLDLTQIRTWKFWKSLFTFRPDILHYIPGPTLQGMFFAKTLQILTRSKLIISATKPDLPTFFRKVAWLIRPDIVIVQSAKSENQFENVKYKTKFIPNGVDTTRFVPVDLLRKRELREHFGIGKDDFVMLHVGPVRTGRNQKALLNLKDGVILLVVSLTNPSEMQVYEKILKEKGDNVIIWKKYFPDIQNIYALADVYLFPVFEELNSIDIPLSVLEAMSCNLPIIASRFGGLERIVKEGDGLFFMENENEIENIITQLKKSKIEVKTRQQILDSRLSWEAVVLSIKESYELLLVGRRI